MQQLSSGRAALKIGCHSQKHREKLYFLPAHGPLELVAIGIIDHLRRKEIRTLFVLMKTDRYSKLTRAFAMKTIGAKEVAQACVKHWCGTMHFQKRNKCHEEPHPGVHGLLSQWLTIVVLEER